MLCASGWVMLGTEQLLDSVQVEDDRYNLAVVHQIGDNHTTCLLYQCNSDDLACNQIKPYDGNCWSLEKSKLEVNPSTNEVNVFIDDEGSDGFRLDFTYGDQPRSYMDKLEWADSDYYLAYFHDYGAQHSTFSFMLYGCEKDSTTCSRLPFRYDTQGLPYGDLEVDEENGEVSVLIRDELIYTYGNSPKCHVEGCSLNDK